MAGLLISREAAAVDGTQSVAMVGSEGAGAMKLAVRMRVIDSYHPLATGSLPGAFNHPARSL